MKLLFLFLASFLLIVVYTVNCSPMEGGCTTRKCAAFTVVEKRKGYEIRDVDSLLWIHTKTLNKDLNKRQAYVRIFKYIEVEARYNLSIPNLLCNYLNADRGMHFDLFAYMDADINEIPEPGDPAVFFYKRNIKWRIFFREHKNVSAREHKMLVKQFIKDLKADGKRPSSYCIAEYGEPMVGTKGYMEIWAY